MELNSSQIFRDLKRQHNQRASVYTNYFTTVSLEKWLQQNGKLNHKMDSSEEWRLCSPLKCRVRHLVSEEPSASSFFIYSPDFLSVLPCLVFSACVGIEITSVLSEALNDDQAVKKNQSWRHVGQFNYINLIIRNFQSIITVKYCGSPLPQTFIILNHRILMRTSVKTGSVWLYFQGNRGHTYLLHQYPFWQVSQNISACVCQVLWTKMFLSFSPKTSF